MNPEWIIVPPEEWDAVHAQRLAAIEKQKEQKEHNDSLPDIVSTRGRLYFIGLAYCSVCGAKMITGYSPYRWKTEDGVTHRRDNPVYRCSAKASGKLDCTGKSSYSKYNLDQTIIEEIKKYLNRIETMELSEAILQLHEESVASDKKQVEILKKRLANAEHDQSNLEREVLKTLDGTARFEAKLLTRLLADNEKKIERLKADLVSAEEMLKKKSMSYDDRPSLNQATPVWSEAFDAAPFDEQRIMLAKIIEKVEIGPSGVRLALRIHIEEFLGCSLSDVSCEKRVENERFDDSLC